MAELVRLRARHTHLYPGARLALAADDAAPRAGSDVAIEFADSGRAAAHVAAADGDRLSVDVAAHRTARGTPIEPKRWLLEPVAASEPPQYRIVRREA